ncbi:MAG: hypothetical protein A2586_00670 [Candidatus Harrisonbacteria bacterium RIFOXYD1_FULL_40_9]|uniref:Ribosome-binding factor A n=1 Tax=Candidatus Harrisonbacteria bacterium RIFOXYD1_FULL_40_9 TaxID=1798412 RepID=A0A1G1ZVV0_9BACT|nr:MAG: hypothetical protein A2586_00670 [Candidatus Harrisonbacteria bacterium RIFOXYD1_FULL_40_9]
MLYREERLNKTIRDELSLLVAREVELGTLTTITEVDVRDTHEDATVKISVIPSSKADEALKILQRESGRLRSLLSRKIRIRAIPRLVFEIDHGPEKAADIEKMFLDPNN